VTFIKRNLPGFLAVGSFGVYVDAAANHVPHLFWIRIACGVVGLLGFTLADMWHGVTGEILPPEDSPEHQQTPGQQEPKFDLERWD
jgi:hypothetical protein